MEYYSATRKKEIATWMDLKGIMLIERQRRMNTAWYLSYAESERRRKERKEGRKEGREGGRKERKNGGREGERIKLLENGKIGARTRGNRERVIKGYKFSAIKKVRSEEPMTIVGTKKN